MSGPTPPLLRVFPVVVGINQYRDGDSQPSLNLHYAVRDAQRVSDFLRQPGSAIEVVPFEPLLDQHATAEHIRQALRLRWASYRLGRGDMLLFYFAGHGKVTPDGRAYLCAYDTNFRDPNSGGLRLDDIYHDMQDVSAETVMIVLDACYSGAIVDAGVINPNVSQQLKAFLSRALPTTSGERTGNRIIFTAVHPNQKARESPTIDGDGGGLFTSALLHGWRDGDARGPDGLITPQSLDAYLQGQFQSYGSGDQQPITVVSSGTLLVIGQFAPLAPGEAAVPTRHLSGSGTFDPMKSVTPIARPATPRSVLQRRLMIVGAVTLGVLAACSLLVAISPPIFAAAYVLACCLAVASVPLSGRAAGLTSIVAIIQLILLIGVAHLHFGLGAGIAVLDALASYAWLALVISVAQGLLVLYVLADLVSSS